MRNDHYLFNDMTTDNHLTSSGVASDWPYGRGIWLSSDKTKMIWVGEEDQLRIISIVHGNDLGLVDASLHELLTKIEKSGVIFAEHPTYRVITTCPTNMGTGKRQSILGKFPNISEKGTTKRNSKKKPRSSVFKPEESEENTQQWTKKEQPIFHHLQDLELLKLT
jgi:arginine kinase